MAVALGLLPSELEITYQHTNLGGHFTPTEKEEFRVRGISSQRWPTTLSPGVLREPICSCQTNLLPLANLILLAVFTANRCTTYLYLTVLNCYNRSRGK